MTALLVPRSDKLDALRGELDTFAGPELLSRFISDILLATLAGDIVIFIEEVGRSRCERSASIGTTTATISGGRERERRSAPADLHLSFVMWKRDRRMG